MSTTLTRIAPHFLLLALVVAVYGSSLGFGFVWDDHLYLLNQEAYRAFDLRRILFSLGNGLEYLPVRDLSYAVDYLLWGRSAFGFHLTNLVIYALTVLAVYGLVRRLAALPDAGTGGDDGRERAVALLGAALFAVHPLHAEVVSFVTGRNSLLAGLFFFLSGSCFLRFLQDSGSRGRWYAAALLAFLLALLSKATSITLPLVLLLLVLLDRPQRPARNLLSLVPFLALAGGAFFLFRAIAQSSFLMPREQVCFTPACLAERGAVALQIPFFYLGKLLWPRQLAPEYDVSFAGSLASPLVLLSLALLLVLTGAAVVLRRRFPPVPVSLGWYLLTLVPVLHLFPTYPIVADRYAYLPSFAVCYLAAAAAVRAGYPRWRRWLVVGGGLLVAGLGALAVRQNGIWQSGETLWRHTLTVSPAAVKAHTNLGRISFDAGRYPEAFTLFARARQLEPTDPHYDFFQGVLCFVRREYPLALEQFGRALAHNGDFIEALLHTGLVYEALGEKAKAAEFYRRTLRSRQDDWGGFKEQARQGLRRLGMAGP